MTMKNTQLFTNTSAFASVQRDTLRLLATNPRIVYSLVPACVRRIREQIADLGQLSTASDSRIREAAASVNAALHALTHLPSRVAVHGGDIDADGLALLQHGVDVEFEPLYPQGVESVLLPTSGSALRGTRVDGTYVYAVPPDLELLGADDVVRAFGGTARVVTQRTGRGQSMLQLVLDSLGPCHITTSDGAYARAPVSVAPLDMAEAATWIATQERVALSRSFGTLRSDVFPQPTERGRVNGGARVGDYLDDVRIVSSVGAAVQAARPLRGGAYRLTPAGMLAWRDIVNRARPISLSRSGSVSYFTQAMTEADTLLSVLSSHAPRDFCSPTTTTEMTTVTRAHGAVGADYALHVITDGQIDEYAALTETTASFRGTMNHTINRALMLEL